MRQQIFRVLGLAAIVLMSNLPLAQAYHPLCHIACCSGGVTYDNPLPSGYTDCCQYFHALCGGIGTAYQDLPLGDRLVCLPSAACGVIQD